MKGSGDVAGGLVKSDGVQAVPIGPIEVELEVPIFGWAKGIAEDDILRQVEDGVGVFPPIDARHGERAERCRHGERIGVELWSGR